MGWIIVLVCVAITVVIVRTGIKKYKTEKRLKSIRILAIGAVFFGVSSFLSLAIKIENSSSKKQIDSAEYLLPSKQVAEGKTIKTDCGEFIRLEKYVFSDSGEIVIKEMTTIITENSHRDRSSYRYDITAQATLQTLLSSDSMLDNKQDIGLTKKYADRYIEKGRTFSLSGSESTVEETNITLDTPMGKVSPCISVRSISYYNPDNDDKATAITRKEIYCKGYGMLYTETAIKDELAVCKSSLVN